MSKHSIQFFDSQFRKQVASGEFALNPFETLALPYLHGDVLDVGCGLGNLALEAARRGCRVTALDGSASAIQRIVDATEREGLSVDAQVADLLHFCPARDYDSIVCIGLLMFLPESAAQALLAALKKHVRPGGVIVINLLTEGTTFMGMFDPDHYCLWDRDALSAYFADWAVLEDCHEVFPAPGETFKAFDTVVARRPVDLPPP